jgi:hypothetical protein
VSGYRKTSDPVVQIRICNTCRATIAGFTESGLVTWCDITPIPRALEAIYHAGGRNTYQIQPRPNRTAWCDWRNPATSLRDPSRGILLVQHPHDTPSRARGDNPAWLITDYRIALADPHEGQAVMF